MVAGELTISKINDFVWQFNEAADMGGQVSEYVDAYLILGQNSALMVDTLMTCGNLYEKVREITDLPIEVIITHGHYDHAGVSTKVFYEAGCNIYMDVRDWDLLNKMSQGNMKIEWFTDVDEGKIFDLGGVIFEVVSVPGHSSGCLAVVEPYKQWMFSGDSIGSGHFWMQLPGCIPLNMFLFNVKKLYDKIKDLNCLLVYPGHRNQSEVQLTGQYVKDVYTITNRVLSGVFVGEDQVLDLHGRHMEFKSIGYGQMVSFCYDPENMFFGRKDPAIEEIKAQFTYGEVTDGGKRVVYRLFSPEVEEKKQYPIVIYLHGAGERGDDNELNLALPGAYTYADPNWQKEHPCYVFAPQCPNDMFWTDENNVALIMKFLNTFLMEKPVDRSRVYVTGLSLGGIGTWNLIEKYPEYFAAAMPICGGGIPLNIKNAKNVPVWAFHAEDDPVVAVGGRLENPLFNTIYGTRSMVAALRGAGNTEVLYTEYPKGYLEKKLNLHPHFAWVPAYENKDAKEWMFSKTRYDSYTIDLLMPGVWCIDDFSGSSFYLVEGKDKALMIDTGLGGGNVKELAKTLTHLPVELAVTHAHIDHVYHWKQFGKFYMNKKEEAMLEYKMVCSAPESPWTMEDIIGIGEGDVIKLGGGTDIEVLELGGHTPGSVAFFDKKHNLCFTGDAVGSGMGVWMQVPGAIALSEYKENLKAFYNKMKDKDLKQIAFLGGHRAQQYGMPKGERYNPVTLELINDMASLCDMVLNDDVEFAPFAMRTFGEAAYQASYQTADMIFTDSVRK